MAREGFAEYNAVATFPDMHSARDAIMALHRAGVDEKNISLLGRAAEEAAAETDVRERDAGMSKDLTKAAGTGAATGAGVGAIAGLVGGALAFGIPGIGPVLGTGIWAAVIGGAGLGAGVGGVASGVAAAGTDETWAQTYQESVRAGHVLVAVSANSYSDLEKAERVLDDAKPMKVEQVSDLGQVIEREHRG